MKDLLSKGHYCFEIHTSFSPFMDPPPPPAFPMIFQKSLPPINKGGFTLW